jgi:hypothetical protein
MKFGVTTLLLVFAFGQLFCQKRLSIYKSFGGVVFEMDSTSISSKQVSIILQQNQKAYQEFKVAKRKALVGNIIGFTGGLLVAVPLISIVAGGQPEWAYVGAGGVLFLGSLPFSSSFRGHALNAIEIYNSGVSVSSHRIRPSFHFYGTGASLVLRF